MSRIGRLPVAIPAGVTVDIQENNHVVVKGPKGTLEREVHKNISLEMNDNVIKVLVSNTYNVRSSYLINHFYIFV